MGWCVWIFNIIKVEYSTRVFSWNQVLKLWKYFNQAYQQLLIMVFYNVIVCQIPFDVQFLHSLKCEDKTENKVISRSCIFLWLWLGKTHDCRYLLTQLRWSKAVLFLLNQRCVSSPWMLESWRIQFATSYSDTSFSLSPTSLV